MIKKQIIAIILLFSLFNLNILRAMYLPFIGHFKEQRKKKIDRGSKIASEIKTHLFEIIQQSDIRWNQKYSSSKEVVKEEVPNILDNFIKNKDSFTINKLIIDLKKIRFKEPNWKELEIFSWDTFLNFFQRALIAAHEFGHAYPLLRDSIEFNYIYLNFKTKQNFIFNNLSNPNNEIEYSLGGLVGTIAFCDDELTESYIKDYSNIFFNPKKYSEYSLLLEDRSFLIHEINKSYWKKNLFTISTFGAVGDLRGIFYTKRHEYYIKHKKLISQNPDAFSQELKEKISAYEELELTLLHTDRKELINSLKTEIIPHLKKNTIDESTNIKNLEEFIKWKEEKNKKMSLSPEEIKTKTDALIEHKLKYGETEILTEKDYTEMFNIFQKYLTEIRENPPIQKILFLLSIYYGCCINSDPTIISYCEFERDFYSLKVYLESVQSSKE